MFDKTLFSEECLPPSSTLLNREEDERKRNNSILDLNLYF